MTWLTGGRGNYLFSYYRLVPGDVVCVLLHRTDVAQAFSLGHHSL